LLCLLLARRQWFARNLSGYLADISRTFWCDSGKAGSSRLPGPRLDAATAALLLLFSIALVYAISSF
jgi:hypothetical protein